MIDSRFVIMQDFPSIGYHSTTMGTGEIVHKISRRVRLVRDAFKVVIL